MGERFVYPERTLITCSVVPEFLALFPLDIDRMEARRELCKKRNFL